MQAVLPCDIYHVKQFSRVSGLGKICKALMSPAAFVIPSSNHQVAVAVLLNSERWGEGQRGTFLSFFHPSEVHTVVELWGSLTNSWITLPREKEFSRDRQLHCHNIYTVNISKVYTFRQWLHTLDTASGKNEKI